MFKVHLISSAIKMLLYKQIIFFLILKCTYAASTKYDENVQIMGGTEANITDFPYQASISYKGFFCGGTIIAPQFILTAAHCLYKATKKDLKVRVGSSSRNKGGQVLGVQRIFRHSKYNVDTYDYDIAILKLNESLHYTDTINEAILPRKREEVVNGVLGTVTGYGRIYDYGPPSKVLMKVDVPIVNAKDCQSYYNVFNITDRMICAGYDEGKKDACEGDSGGPLAINNKVIGIVSYGEGCGQPRSPGGYTKVSYFIKYIKNILQK